MLNKIILLTISVLAFSSAIALDSDRDQPATLEADDFELDLKTGVRTYRGNVLYRQGSIRLECDELVTYFNDDGELDKAICSGDPGKFKQRPENSEEDMIGKARVITLDQVAELVTMKSRADVVQGGTRLTGRLLTYNLATEKVIVKGGSDTQTKTTTTSSTEADTTAKEAEPAEAEESAASSRPTIIIQPRKKKN
ncbi:MAG: lipopolysaccharide transport periplasmic protein LptA [bacterium]